MRKKIRRSCSRTRAANLLLLLVLVAVAPTIASCSPEGPPDIPWAAPVAESASAADDEIQSVFDAYAAALVAKDRDAFLSLIDDQNPAYYAAQELLYDNALEIPYRSIEMRVTSRSQTGSETLTAKVAEAWTYSGSFTGMPFPQRTAYTIVRRGGAWKISADATQSALGKPREARLEDFGRVEVLELNGVLVLHQAVDADVAARVAALMDAAFPRLESAIPDVTLPKVPILVFNGQERIDLAFPGKWAEWTGGASMQLGETGDEGGAIIIEAETFRRVDAQEAAYNPRMLSHELAHIALFSLVTDRRTPPFLIEGLADNVAGERRIVLLKDKLASGLPFSPSIKDLSQPGSFSALLDPEAATLAYEQSDSAVNLIEESFGAGSTLKLIREFKRASADESDQNILVDSVFRSVLDTSWEDFEEQWREYVLNS